MSKNRIKHVFLNSDLTCGHIGLRNIAKAKANLKDGEHVVFVNAKKDKMKVLSPKKEVGKILAKRIRQ